MLAIHIETCLPRYAAGPRIQGYRFCDEKEEGAKTWNYTKQEYHLEDDV